MSLLTCGDDLRNLKLLVPNCEPNPPNELALLQSMISLCRRDWVKSFLLTTSPAHMTFMTSPSFVAKAVSVRHREVSIIPTALSGFRLSEGRAISALVPAFCVESISVGFGVAEMNLVDNSRADDESGKENDVWFWGGSICNFRYACDTTTGSYVIVMEEGDEINISWVSPVSANLRRRCGIKFSRKDLEQIWSCRTQPKGADVLKSLSHIMVLQEFRNCPACRSSPGNACTCPNLDMIPKHPLDVAHVTNVISLHSGSFEAIAQFSSYANGSKMTQYARGLRTNVEGVVAPDTISRLIHWAVSGHVRTFYTTPVDCLLPEAAPDASENFFSLHEEICFGSPDNDVTFEDVLAGIDVTAESNLFGENGGNDDLLTVPDGTAIECDKWSEYRKGTAQSQKDRNESRTVCYSSDRHSKSSCPGMDETQIPSDIIRFETSSGFPDVADSNADLLGTIQFELTVPIMPTTEPPQSAEEGQGPPIRRYRRRRRGVDPHDPAEIQRREEYLRIRRQKNREAARRSNEKRRIQNDNRKQALQMVRQEVEMLREKEKSLREENMQLRREISKQGKS